LIFPSDIFQCAFCSTV